MKDRIKLNLPECNVRIREQRGKEEVWDPIRKKWLVLTPEEWVRQHVIGYLTGDRGMDPMLIKLEQGLTLYNTARRADIVVYDRSAAPRMVVECKAPHIKLTRDVVEQAVRYNLVLEVPYIVITNGLAHYCFRYDAAENRLTALAEIPQAEALYASGTL